MIPDLSTLRSAGHSAELSFRAVKEFSRRFPLEDFTGRRFFSFVTWTCEHDQEEAIFRRVQCLGGRTLTSRVGGLPRNRATRKYIQPTGPNES